MHGHAPQENTDDDDDDDDISQTILVNFGHTILVSPKQRVFAKNITKRAELGQPSECIMA